MEKITLKALQLAGFQNADMISKIISYVPNPQVAAEMLLGVYTPMTINAAERFRKSRYASDSCLFEIVDIDELGDTVSYRRYYQNTQTVYYATKEAYELKVFITERIPNAYTTEIGRAHV